MNANKSYCDELKKCLKHLANPKEDKDDDDKDKDGDEDGKEHDYEEVVFVAEDEEVDFGAHGPRITSSGTLWKLFLTMP